LPRGRKRTLDERGVETPPAIAHERDQPIPGVNAQVDLDRIHGARVFDRVCKRFAHGGDELQRVIVGHAHPPRELTYLVTDQPSVFRVCRDIEAQRHFIDTCTPVNKKH
jgi:hypothetical protein